MLLTVTMNAAIDKRYVVRRFDQGEVNRVSDCIYTPGGKGINVSKQAKIAGEEVTATGIVGGYAGEYIESSLLELGITPAFYHVKGESRSCINIWDEENQRQTEFLEPGVCVSKDEAQAFLRQFEKLVEKADIVEISGSLPVGMEAGIYAEMIYMCRQRNKPVILDTSGKLLEEGIKATPTLIKPNIDEIRMLTGRTISTAEEAACAAAHIHRCTKVEYVVVSLGDNGSVMACQEGMYRARVPKINAVNTVGCGDAMIAGFARAIRTGEHPASMLCYASAVSAASAMTTQTGFFRMEDMKEIYRSMTIERLEEG